MVIMLSLNLGLMLAEFRTDVGRIWDRCWPNLGLMLKMGLTQAEFETDVKNGTDAGRI